MATPRVAVVGLGAWGRNLGRNFHQLGALAAVCDTDPSALAGAPDGVRTTADYRGLLADPDIDAVALATPDGAHHGMALAALEAGKDVFVEKPLALTVAAGRELLERARQTDRILMVDHLLRFHPAVRALSGLVESGALGELQYIYSNRLNFGKMDGTASILWSFAPHDISLILSLVGRTPERVLATGAAYLSPGVADVTVTHLQFGGPVRAHIHVSWLHPYKDHRLVVIGSEGMVVFDDQQPWSRKLVHYPHAVEWVDDRPIAQAADGREVEVEPTEPLRIACEHFLHCVTHRETPLTDGHEALRVLTVLQAAQESLDHDQPVVPGRRPAPRKTASPSSGENVRIHETAYVDDDVEIGEGSSIWHFSKILGPAKLGARCSLGQNVVVERHVTLGDNVRVQNNVSIYSGVILEDDVFCGPSMVFTNIGTPRSHYPRKGQYDETLVKRGASIGANATIVCGNTIGAYALIGAGAVVTRSVPDHALVYGNPARVRGWVCYCGEPLPLGIEPGEEDATCGECGRDYHRRDHDVAITRAPEAS